MNICRADRGGNEIRARVSAIEIYTIGDSSNRSRGRQYQSDDLAELFLAFGTRTWKVNTKEKLIDEFTRCDFSVSIKRIGSIEKKHLLQKGQEICII